ncbi:MAG: selenide, water dikinase SelD [Ignavibacteria bacterium]|nr:selenide, water dikinase SelD [Ignavibacteria bacterium]
MLKNEEKIRLTQMVTSAGCAAKLFPYLLSDALKDICWYSNERVLVGFDRSDDAGVYKMNDDYALIHTTDFFTPVVDDPFTFGMIAAANSLSDVYAMGGIPMNALNIVIFPQKENLDILKEILKGGNEKAKEAGCVIIGGHTVDNPNIVYGLAVTGYIHPENIKGNHTVKPGDRLILTKGLGTGILNNCIKYDKLDEEVYKGLINSMTRLNKYAAEAMIKFDANGCTDITGFGLAGHSMQMAKASGVVLHIEVEKLPLLEGTMHAIEKNMLTRGDKSNRIYTQDYVVNEGKINLKTEHLLYDPQTSGGLLISLDSNDALNLLEMLHKTGDTESRIVGYAEEPKTGIKAGTIIFHF